MWPNKHMLKKAVSSSTLLAVLLAGVFFLLMFVLINGNWIGTGRLMEITGGVNILDFEFAYGAEEAYAHLNALGAEGRAFYQSRVLPLDFFFPLGYAAFYFCVIAYLLRRNEKMGWRWLLVLPPLAMLMDFAENAAILVMLARFPAAAPVGAVCAGVVSTLKYLLMLGNITAILILLGMLMRGRRKGQTSV